MKPAPSYEEPDINNHNVNCVFRLELALWLHVMVITVY